MPFPCTSSQSPSFQIHREEVHLPHSTAAVKNSSLASATSRVLGQVNLPFSGQKWPHPKISIQIENEPALWVVVAMIECLAL